MEVGAGDEQVYTDDPRGNLVVCGADPPAARHSDLHQSKPPPIDTEEKAAGASNQLVIPEPTGADEFQTASAYSLRRLLKNKAQTAVIKRLIQAGTYMKRLRYQQLSFGAPALLRLKAIATTADVKVRRHLAKIKPFKRTIRRSKWGRKCL